MNIVFGSHSWSTLSLCFNAVVLLLITCTSHRKAAAQSPLFSDVIQLCKYVDGANAHRVGNYTRAETSKALMHASDKMYPPEGNKGQPLTIELTFTLMSLDSINDYDMSVSMTFRKWMTWEDKRLDFSQLNNIPRLLFDAKSIENFWVPDITVSNVISASVPKIATRHHRLTVHSKGIVTYMIQMTVLVYCNMDLRQFPFDTQECFVDMESYLHSNASLNLKWRSDRPVRTSPYLSEMEFTLVSVDAKRYMHDYGMTGFSGLRATFTVRRVLGHYLTQIFLPTGLTVVVSWLSFWLDVEAVPARISLGVLTIVTLYGELAHARAGLPNVPYVKAMDVWIGTCMLFLMASNVQFAIVNLHVRDEKITNFWNVRRPTMVVHDGVDTGEKVMQSLDAIKRQNVHRAIKLDKVCRIIFPIMFAAFNGFYWSYYYFLDN